MTIKILKLNIWWIENYLAIKSWFIVVPKMYGRKLESLASDRKIIFSNSWKGVNLIHP